MVFLLPLNFSEGTFLLVIELKKAFTERVPVFINLDYLTRKDIAIIPLKGFPAVPELGCKRLSHPIY